MAPLLDVRGLCVHFPTSAGVSRAVDGISFQIHRDQTLGLVGESGCGKSATALALLGLHPASTHVSGSVHFDGVSLLDLPDSHWMKIRGRGIALVFQEPGIGLNPIYRLGRQLAEMVRLHQGLSRRAAWHAALELLAAVQLDNPGQVAGQYPHEISGGMQQRIALALALAGRPRLLIADEPTTALDVTVQKEILLLLRQLTSQLGMALLLISHDLDVVDQMADTVAVMYAGQIVEYGPVANVFHNPLHPYTEGLLACRPRLGQTGRLRTIDGVVPVATQFPAGCRFRERCSRRSDLCFTEPGLEEHKPGRWAACWYWSMPS
jgi:peptide/nickel transport system ATP-binding protein